jgi:hypothetical protein
MTAATTPVPTAQPARPRTRPRSTSRSGAHKAKTALAIPAGTLAYPYGSHEGDHAALDRLITAYLRTHQTATLGTTDVFSLANWSIGRCNTPIGLNPNVEPPTRTMAAGGNTN